LNLLGHGAGGLRLPLVDATEDELAQVRAMLVRHGLLSDGDEMQAASAGASPAQAPNA
jgi:hypothetical protein